MFYLSNNQVFLWPPCNPTMKLLWNPNMATIRPLECGKGLILMRRGYWCALFYFYEWMFLNGYFLIKCLWSVQIWGYLTLGFSPKSSNIGNSAKLLTNIIQIYQITKTLKLPSQFAFISKKFMLPHSSNTKLKLLPSLYI